MIKVLWRSAKMVAKLCLDAEYRSIVGLRVFNARNVHQTTALTRMNRYPRIFSACRSYFENRTELRILSYGCATGEEVCTLRLYFPSAFIIGAEINRRSLARCLAREVDDRITFVYSDHDLIARHGPFDAVFCMAVLQRTPHSIDSRKIASLKRLYPFEKFDRQVERLDSLLRKDGLLVIRHAQYELSDASVAAKFTALDDVAPDHGRPRFDRHSDRKPQPSSRASIFVKTRN